MGDTCGRIYTFLYNISNGENKVSNEKSSLKNFLNKSIYNPEVVRISGIITRTIFGYDLLDEKRQIILFGILRKFYKDLPKNFDSSKKVDSSKLEFMDKFYEKCPTGSSKFLSSNNILRGIIPTLLKLYFILIKYTIII